MERNWIHNDYPDNTRDRIVSSTRTLDNVHGTTINTDSREVDPNAPLSHRFLLSRRKRKANKYYVIIDDCLVHMNHIGHV